ncbi:replication fork protection component Swi3-domain-containing protein [Podospora aff. communis PSN243]|uniref:Chromosome segregation in meiosis protein n=1 Tax=Podospora aff. communis PSN243 TaxID=3040156 RepID=A0AAV9G3D6_9PEZI|nr:replication fork protection component Swi3-domain-containing protein [Podospora aff. communis PSN243]
MPSKTAASKGPEAEAFVEDYLAGFDDDEDPFASPVPATKSNDANGKKRKGTDALGIDEEIDLKKKPRVPRVKLDEGRLLSEKGIPKLRKMAPRLKLKGKGHEFSDASRLLSFYQEWLDDLFPKATFLDALAMVEKAGHKTIMRNERLKWIEEGRPKAKEMDDEEIFGAQQTSKSTQPTRIAPIFDKPAGARATTPKGDDPFGDEDLYNATRLARTGANKPNDDVPDDDDLAALMAEQDAPSTGGPSFGGSIFGGGQARKPAQPSGAPDDDEMEALMAEAEWSQSAKPAGAPVRSSLFGDGSAKATTKPVEEYEDDLDALMAEAEAEAAPKTAPKIPANAAQTVASGKAPGNNEDEGDDLDALMAEAEAEAPVSAPKEASKDKQPSAEDEEAMAEMEGLW